MRTRIDWFLVALVAILVLGIVVPLPKTAITALKYVSTGSVVLLFLAYGARISTREVWEGLKNWRLQLGVLAATYLVFPVLGMLSYPLFVAFLGPVFALGMLYLTLLPSTVQSSIAFTSLARGNVAGAICAATISNVVGVLATPLLVMACMGKAAGVHMSAIRDVVLLLLLPFCIGQVLEPRLGNWVRKHSRYTRVIDRGTILLVVASGVAGATASGLWAGITWRQAIALLAASALVLGIMLAVTWYGGKLLGLARVDRIALLMCGSKKSLATGLPMASVIFQASMIAAVTVPVIVFHQFQLMACSAIARHLARQPSASHN